MHIYLCHGFVVRFFSLFGFAQKEPVRLRVACVGDTFYLPSSDGRGRDTAVVHAHREETGEPQRREHTYTH